MSESTGENQEMKDKDVVLEGGTYEILRKRLQEHGNHLQEKLSSLNKERKGVFGSIEPKLLATERITTENNCIPRDIVSLGETFLFAYNVQFGLKQTTEISDVFALYELKDLQFEQRDLGMLESKEFLNDFANLYKYYKHTIFARFYEKGPYLYMIFRIGKSVTDIKAFKWLIKPDKTLEYVDNRSDHEISYPAQHEFEWIRATRDDFRDGKHPHVSIQERVFIECVGGDLTIKIEDNTESGEGILSEKVDDPEQKLDDADIQYAFVGPLVLLKVRPYREEKYRYFIYNEKVQEAIRFDEIHESCVLLPDDQGLIFPNGYYLISGEAKRFDYQIKDILFEKRIESPNGEDTLYAFYQREHGVYILLSYNLIDQNVQTPIQCHGACFFHQGEMMYFRAEESPQKHHSVQIWQTPYVSPDYNPPVVQDSFLFKIGNKELVRAMAECQNIINLISREDTYQALYDDIYNFSVGVLDSYFWIGNEDAHNLGEALDKVRDTASSAIDEFDKVRRIRSETNTKISAIKNAANELMRSIKPDLMDQTDQFISALSKLRKMRGDIIGLKELRYADVKLIEDLENNVVEKSDELSEQCVDFLLRPDALDVYHEKVEQVSKDTEEIQRAVEAKELEERITTISSEIETMIEVVGNLKIGDATKSTQIIDGCSSIFTLLNTARAELRNKKKSMQSAEAVAEFAAQLKLLDQSVVSYLDVADSPEKCDEYQNKLLVQIEELEGRFADFDEYVIELAEKRAELTDALEARKLALIEEKNKRAQSLHQAADRILKAIEGRAQAFKEVADINSFFAGDLMIEKVRSIIEKLVELDDSVKADEVESRLKSTQESAVRQLKDKSELYVDGKNIIQFGRHKFSVNVQKTDLSILARDGKMFFHITGTNFFEEVKDELFNETKSVWNQEVVSENREVYRAEYLAYSILKKAGTEEISSIDELAHLEEEAVLELVRKYMSPRYEEGYTKGVHDGDGAKILSALINLHQEANVLRFDADTRAVGRLYWHLEATEDQKEQILTLFKGIGDLRRSYKSAREFQAVISRVSKAILPFVEALPFFNPDSVPKIAEYLFEELTLRDQFIISPSAARIHDEFIRQIRERHLMEEFEDPIDKLQEDVLGGVQLVRGWLQGFLAESIEDFDARFLNEAMSLLLTKSFNRDAVHTTSVVQELDKMKGDHDRIKDGVLTLDLPEFLARLDRYNNEVVPLYQTFLHRKKELIEEYSNDLRLQEFSPRVLTSFVRNKLIDEVYLPIIGDNLAKQIGSTGADKRTDLMGMLLLISPPGYGKTTLMEYIASRLGVIFVKINGPAIGHYVTSIDPQEAPNAAARDEIEKLNLAFEMGDNIMIYLDDIQHCNPELLQKFISLCDGQRRIEGVWKGRSRTYDFRGRKVAVVMAGNPYTESGDKFQIPDMLANRADTYNLGDILGDYREAFELSYIENSLTSNPVLNQLATKSKKDIYQLVRLARTDQREGIDLEGSYSASEVNEIVSVLKKLLRIQDVILKVNQEYIRSAAQADEYRTEPAFKLQGSYRNMNKLAEKVLPIMNDQELENLIVSHYEGEAQTLTTGAEANLLKFRELTGLMNEEQTKRWQSIKETFQKNQRFHGMDSQDSMSRAVSMLGDLSFGVEKITSSLSPLGTLADKAPEQAEMLIKRLEDALKASRETNGHNAPEIKIPDTINTTLSAESIEPIISGLKELLDATQKQKQNGDGPKQQVVPTPPQPLELSESSMNQLIEVLKNVRIKTEYPTMADSLDKLEDEQFKRGELLGSGVMRKVLEENGFDVDELPDRTFVIKRDEDRPIFLQVRNDRLILRVELESVPQIDEPGFAEELLTLNSAIQPVCFAIQKDENQNKRLFLIETREGKNLTRSELNQVIAALENASKRADELLR